MDFAAAIRTIPDYPKKGIQFRDVTTLFGNPRAFRAAVDALVQPYAGVRDRQGRRHRSARLYPGRRGGASALHRLRAHPQERQTALYVIGEEYDLEYGQDRIEIHTDAVKPGDYVVVVDDLIATGGTAFAGIKLLERAGAKVIGCCFVIDLPELGGADKIRALGKEVTTLVSFGGH